MHNILCVGQAGLKIAKAYKIVGGITKLLGFHLPGAANMAWVAEAEQKAWTPVPCDCGSELSYYFHDCCPILLLRVRTVQIQGRLEDKDCAFQCVREAVEREPGLPTEQPMVRRSRYFTRSRCWTVNSMTRIDLSA